MAQLGAYQNYGSEVLYNRAVNKLGGGAFDDSEVTLVKVFNRSNMTLKRGLDADGDGTDEYTTTIADYRNRSNSLHGFSILTTKYMELVANNGPNEFSTIVEGVDGGVEVRASGVADGSRIGVESELNPGETIVVTDIISDGSFEVRHRFDRGDDGGFNSDTTMFSRSTDGAVTNGWFRGWHTSDATNAEQVVQVLNTSGSSSNMGLIGIKASIGDFL